MSGGRKRGARASLFAAIYVLAALLGLFHEHERSAAVAHDECKPGCVDAEPVSGDSPEEESRCVLCHLIASTRAVLPQDEPLRLEGETVVARVAFPCTADWISATPLSHRSRAPPVA